LKKSIDLSELKSEYWDDKTLHTHIREEIYKASSELMVLHKKYRNIAFLHLKKRAIENFIIIKSS